MAERICTGSDSSRPMWAALTWGRRPVWVWRQDLRAMTTRGTLARARTHAHTRLQTNRTAAAPPCRTQADKLAALHNNTHARPHSGYIKYVHMHMCARGACTWTLMERPFLVSLRHQLPAALWIMGRARAPPLPTTTTTLRYAALWGKWRQAYTTERLHPEEGAPL